MDVVKAGLTIFLLILTIDLPEILGRTVVMTQNSRRVKPSPTTHTANHLCGDHLIWVLKSVCTALWESKWPKRRHSRKHRRDTTTDQIVQMKYEATDFLSSIRRRRDNDNRRSTDLQEECCGEGCRVEEIAEYC